VELFNNVKHTVQRLITESAKTLSSLSPVFILFILEPFCFSFQLTFDQHLSSSSSLHPHQRVSASSSPPSAATTPLQAYSDGGGAAEDSSSEAAAELENGKADAQTPQSMYPSV
jgi:hypothetical protein